MSVRKMLREKKKSFFDARQKYRVSRSQRELEDLKLEQARQEELTELNKQKVKLQRDIEPMQQFNKKNMPESKLLMFGKGLQKVVNRGYQKAKQAKKDKVAFKGIDFGTSKKDYDFMTGKKRN